MMSGIRSFAEMVEASTDPNAQMSFLEEHYPHKAMRLRILIESLHNLSDEEFFQRLEYDTHDNPIAKEMVAAYKKKRATEAKEQNAPPS